MKWIQLLLIANLGISIFVLLRLELVHKETIRPGTQSQATSRTREFGPSIKGPTFFLQHRDELRLSPQQVHQIHSIDEEYAEKVGSLRVTLKRLVSTAKERFLNSHPIDIAEGLDATERILSLEKEIKLAQTEGKGRVRNILSNEQFKVYQQLIRK